LELENAAREDPHQIHSGKSVQGQRLLPDKDYLYHMGRAHQLGMAGLPRDPPLAAAYYAEAASLGHKGATVALDALKGPVLSRDGTTDTAISTTGSLSHSKSHSTFQTAPMVFLSRKRSRSLARLDSLDSGMIE